MSNGMFADVVLPYEDAQEGRRSAIEMACDVLRVISEEGQTKPTHILQKANMNWSTLCANLDYLCVRGLVERVGRQGKRIEYRLTLKGKSILELYEGLKFSLRGLEGDQTRHGHRRNGKFSKDLEWNAGGTWTFSTVQS